ncbi:hypothetical protein [Cytobacillus firmus]|uniref:DUF4367 domain-containing protein n=1 Tax=Cytobacillus firmus TaxID=1399 RepID=A0A800N8Q5_CYTFI|nr:hypothetical protein KIS1582_4221 [Cytobacillus firmus]
MVIIKILKIIVLFIVLTFSISSGAEANYTSEEFQQSLFDIGFKEVNAALQESKDHFKKDIALPVQIPPIEFTHSFGRLSDLDGDINDGFEIEYRHINKPKNHYMIMVKPVKYGLPIRKEHIEQTFKLKDGSKAIYSTNIARGFNLLVFEKNGWQYILNINKSVSDQVQPEILLEIANSIRQ